jgi:hypothetical protein
MDWCSAYLTPQALSKYIYLSPPLIFPTTSTELGQKTARCESFRALFHYIEWDRIVTLAGSKSGLRATLSYLKKKTHFRFFRDSRGEKINTSSCALQCSYFSYTMNINFGNKKIYILKLYFPFTSSLVSVSGRLRQSHDNAYQVPHCRIDVRKMSFFPRIDRLDCFYLLTCF